MRWQIAPLPVGGGTSWFQCGPRFREESGLDNRSGQRTGDVEASSGVSDQSQIQFVRQRSRARNLVGSVRALQLAVADIEFPFVQNKFSGETFEFKGIASKSQMRERSFAGFDGQASGCGVQ